MKLVIRWKKGRDGPHALVCTREDGSTTVQHTSHQFFPFHDLTHYAVETVLGHRMGFYGLVAAGWDLTDFGNPWPRGRLPSGMDPSELIVGQMDIEKATGVEVNANLLNDHVRAWLSENAPSQSPGRAVSDADLAAIRSLCATLHEQWLALEPGHTMELVFSADAPANEEAS